ncbi:MAG: universal stress protein [Mycetocola sp.]
MPDPDVVLVGVVPRQLDTVLAKAAEFASRFNAMLVCARVDPSRYVVERFKDGRFSSMPIDPDIADLRIETFDESLRDQIAKILEPTGVRWSVQPLVGDPSRELAALADRVDALMIVVGTRAPGFRGTLQEFFTGSVTAQLAHRQHRPLVVVPNPSTRTSAPPPWVTGE